jgi:hypothetical protein
MSSTTTATGTEYIAGIRAKLIDIRNELMAEVALAMRDSLQAGKEIAQERIELSTTQTGRDRAAQGGRPGRIETGDYIDDFDHQIYQLDRDRMQGRFGWLEGGWSANAFDGTYIELQEEGFQNVPGVHALLEASEVAKAEFRDRLTRYVQREFS